MMTAGDLPDAVAALLLDYELSEAERNTVNPFWLLDLEYPDDQHGCPTWRAHRAVLLPHFVKRNPGRRPSRWWTHDAPEPERRRLGGVGTPSWFGAGLARGIPGEWLTVEDIEWLAEAGEVVPIDPADPPIYEAQATYLRRHGLFLRGEERRLPADAFEPEEVVP